MNVNLCQLLKEGHLGIIHTGMSMTSLIDLLGIYDDKSIKGCIIKYGSIEFTFFSFQHEKVLSIIGLYLDTQLLSINFPSSMNHKGWWPDSTTTDHFFATYCNYKGIKTVLYEPLSFDDQKTLITEKGTEIIFRKSGKDYIFDKILVSIHK